MSIITFELTADHIKILTHLQFKTEVHTLHAGNENISPFGGEDFYEDIGLIIYGNIQQDFDPLSDEGPSYNTEQKLHLEKIFQDLPQALEVVLGAKTFEPGTYRRKWHELPQDWKLLSK
jgi:hypothetical protein